MPFISETSRRTVQQTLLPKEYVEEQSFGDVFEANFDYVVDEELFVSQWLNREGWSERKETAQRMIEDGVIDAEKYTDTLGRFQYGMLANDFNEGVFGEEIVGKYGRIKGDDELTKERNAFLAKRRDKLQRINEEGSGFAQVAGSLTAYALDPVNLVTVPFSGIVTAAKGLSVAAQAYRAAKVEAALSATTELFIQPFVYQHKMDIESPYSASQAITNIVEAATVGGALGYVAGGISGYLRRNREKAQALRELPELQSLDELRALDGSIVIEEGIEFHYQREGVTPAYIVDGRYQEFIQAKASGDIEGAVQTRNKTVVDLQSRIKELESSDISLARWVKDNGGLNKKEWQNEGFDPAAMNARDYEVGVWRKGDGGMTPDDLAELLGQSPDIAPEWFADAQSTGIRKLGANDAIMWAQRFASDPKAKLNPEVQREIEALQDEVDRLKSTNDVDALEDIYKDAGRVRIEDDAEIIRGWQRYERDANKRVMTGEMYRQPEALPERAATITELERQILVDQGLDAEFDLAMREFEQLPTEGRVYAEVSDEGITLKDSDAEMAELNKQLDALEEIRVCTLNA